MEKQLLAKGILAALGLTLLACQNKEIDFIQRQTDSPVFYASIEDASEPDTRVYIDESLRLLWHADDRVSIFNKYTFNQQYRFDGETGANAGTFTIVPSESFVTGNTLPAIYAVYPYDENTSITNDCEIELTLPAEQEYASLGFGPGANTMVSATEDNNLLFKNLGGYLAVKLYGDNVTVSKVTLRGNKSEKLAGHATVTAPLDGDPTVVMAEDATEEITVNCAEPVTIGTSAENYTEFWFVLPPTTFDEGFTITVTDQYGGIFVKSTSRPIDITRNHLSRMSPIEVQPDYTDRLAAEREALVELYNALDGDHWINNDNWCSDKPVGEWYGVGTNWTGCVAYIDLIYNNLGGYLPTCISSFACLNSFNIYGNGVTGPIPDDYVFLFDEGKSFIVNNNPLTGPLPQGILHHPSWQYKWADFIQGTQLEVEYEDIPFPEFSVVDLNGNPLESEDLVQHAKCVVFVGWYPGWMDAYDKLIPYYNAYKEDGLVVIGIVSPDNVEHYRGNADHYPWPFVLLDGSANCIIPNRTYYPMPIDPSITAFKNNELLLSNSLRIEDDVNKLVRILTDIFAVETHLPEGEVPPDDEIWYISTTGGIIDIPVESAFKVPVVSHTYDQYGIIKFASGLTTIGDAHYGASAYQNQGAFAFVEVLKEMALPDSITEIGDYSFAYCTQLTRINIPQSCHAIGNNAFYSCRRLESVVFPELLNGIGDWAFASCREFDEIVFPEGLEYLGGAAFNECDQLTSVYLPETIQYMGLGTFSTCLGMQSFSGKYATSDGLALIEEIGGEKWLLQFALGNALDSYTVPDGVTIVHGFANSNVDEIVLPDSVKEIWAQAFMSSTLSRINLPQGLEAVGKEAFFRCQLSSVTLPSSLMSIGDFAFENHLSLVNCKSYLPATLGQFSFGDTDRNDLEIRVPRGFYDTFVNRWSDYGDAIVEFEFNDIVNPGFYLSEDFSKDGVATTLETSSSGYGVDVILLGDGFSDRQIDDGTYDHAMRQAMGALFYEEPYKSYRDCFNVHFVNVVSMTEGYEHGGQALGTGFGDGTYVYGNDSKVIEYAKKAVPEDKLDDALIIVMMNKDAYAGTCYMYYPESGDYGRGLAIAYFPTNSDTEAFNGMVSHEAGGHGFAKLADEYAYESAGAVTQEIIDDARMQEAYGWYKNIDFTGDPAQVKWSRFIGDERYAGESIGCYEGAFTYWTGVWRPTENSIMRYNTGGFNAPSRYAIWYRINKLAYGEGWTGTYEDFVEYDSVNRTPAAHARRRTNNYVEKPLPPLAPPVIVGHSWQDEMK